MLKRELVLENGLLCSPSSGGDVRDIRRILLGCVVGALCLCPIVGVLGRALSLAGPSLTGGGVREIDLLVMGGVVGAAVRTVRGCDRCVGAYVGGGDRLMA